VLLIGYSQGADTLPFMVNRLPAATRELVGFTTLLGISDNARLGISRRQLVGQSEQGRSHRTGTRALEWFAVSVFVRRE